MQVGRAKLYGVAQSTSSVEGLGDAAEVLASAQSYPHIMGVWIVNPDGRLLASYVRSGGEPAPEFAGGLGGPMPR